MKNKINAILIFSLFLFLLLFQPVTAEISIEWQKSLGGSGNDYANSIIKTSDGGYAIAGWTDSDDGDVSGNHGSEDLFIIKLDPAEEIQWQKSLGGKGNESASAIIQTSDGGYAVAGTSDSDDGDVSGNHGSRDFWIVKLDNNGEIQWQKSLGGTGNEGATSITETQDGGYAVAGTSDSDDGDVSGNHGRHDYWIVKLDPTGEIQWQKSFGGSGDDFAYSFLQTTDGGYAVAGTTDSNDGDVSGNHGSRDFWVLRLDSNGEIQWQKALGARSDEIAYSIIQTTDGGYAVAGTSDSNNGYLSDNKGSYDFWVVKLDDDGGMQWQESIGTYKGEGAASLVQTSDGRYAVAGMNTDSDWWIAELGPDGELIWQDGLGGSGDEAALSIIEDLNGRYTIAGITTSDDGDVSGNHGLEDIWVAKITSKTGFGDFIIPLLIIIMILIWIGWGYHAYSVKKREKE